MPKNSAVDTDKKLAKAFPKDVSPPPLLFDFAAWYRARPAGCLGGVELFARKVGDFLPPQADADADFALFFNMGDGGAAGLWLRDERDADLAPFVLLDSEGGVFDMAPNLACFLDRIAKQQFSTDQSEADFLYDVEYDQTPSLIGEFADWLQAHPIAAAILKTTALADYSDFDSGACRSWFQDHVAQLEQAAFADPDIKAISEILTSNGLRPDADELGFGQERFRVFAAGETMIIKRGATLIASKNGHDLRAIDDSVEAALRPHLFSQRTKHARAKKGEGLWPAATLLIDDKGRVHIVPDYDFEFAIGYDDFSASDFAKDQNQFPRRAAKLAPWHKALIEKG